MSETEDGADEARKPNPVDEHVGNRVRLRRLLLGMSQEELGGELNLSFQQVQKYERGGNRISASKLFRIAQVLGVPIEFFFEGLTATAKGVTSNLADFGVLHPDTLRLMEAVQRMDIETRKKFRELAEVVSPPPEPRASEQDT